MNSTADHDATADAAPQMPASQPLLLKALKWGILATVVLILLFGGIGLLAAGTPGLVGGIIGTAMGGVFLLLTVGSIAFANRFIESPNYVVLFFVMVLGSWILKFLIFIIATVMLKGQPWLDTTVLFFGVVASVLVSLVIDVLVIAKSRVPYVSDPR